MVAIRELLPDDPGDRNAVETALRKYPQIMGFIKRFERHVQSRYRNPNITIATLNYDEWDPPVMVRTTASIPNDEYISELHALRNWAQNDPDYDASIVHISLLPRLESSVSR